MCTSGPPLPGVDVGRVQLDGLVVILQPLRRLPRGAAPGPPAPWTSACGFSSNSATAALTAFNARSLVAAGQRLQLGDQQVGFTELRIDLDDLLQVLQGELPQHGPAAIRAGSAREIGAHSRVACWYSVERQQLLGELLVGVRPAPSATPIRTAWRPSPSPPATRPSPSSPSPCPGRPDRPSPRRQPTLRTD